MPTQTQTIKPKSRSRRRSGEIARRGRLTGTYFGYSKPKESEREPVPPRVLKMFNVQKPASRTAMFMESLRYRLRRLMFNVGSKG